MVHHVPIEKSKTVIFWLEHEDKYVKRLYKKNFQILSVGKAGNGRRFLQTFQTFSKKISILDTILEIFLKKSGKSANNHLFFPHCPTEGIWKFFWYCLNIY